MEPLNREGNADRPRSAEGKQSGRVIVIGPYLRMRRGDADAQAKDVARDSEARLEEATGLARAIDLTIAEALVHALTVAATRYEPFCKGLMLFIVMAWEAEVNPFGPCQLYEAPVSGEADKLRVVPSQTVVDPETTGVAGIGLTVA